MKAATRFCAVICLVGFCVLGANGSDLLTPAFSSLPDDGPVLGTLAPLDLNEIAEEITDSVTFKLDTYAHVRAMPWNWRGAGDASMECQVAFTPTALYVEGTFADDYPFCQPMLRPSKPDWWGIGYGADGIEFILEDATTSTRTVRFLLNFSSRAVAPRVELAQSLTGTPPGFVGGAAIELRDGEVPSVALKRRSGTNRVGSLSRGSSIISSCKPPLLERTATCDVSPPRSGW
ncbi:MAG: hypothetical protein KatS3mg130_0949 [Candidatus Sumerlaea sp.]|nr:MAG: hypothetical protein KatS3mg130_0949 [Candidatus Sumerlaea sp.]